MFIYYFTHPQVNLLTNLLYFYKQVLDDMTTTERPHFSFDETARIGAKYGMAPEDTDKMLQVLDELGVVVHQVKAKQPKPSQTNRETSICIVH